MLLAMVAGASGRSRALPSLLLSIALGATPASCLVSFEDYPVLVPDGAAGDASAVGGSSGVPGSGGTGGTGGASGNSGSSGQGGGAGAAGTGIIDASPDAPPSCADTGFSIEPDPPTATSPFRLTYQDPAGLVCIAWSVNCSNGPPTTQPDVEIACDSGPCWSTIVSNCAAGPATVEFVHNKDVGDGAYCSTTFPGSPGQLVAACSFNVSP